jgi:hypothetical protein
MQTARQAFVFLSLVPASIPPSRALTARASTWLPHFSTRRTWTFYFTWLPYYSTWRAGTFYLYTLASYFSALAANASAFARLFFKVTVADSAEGSFPPGNALNSLLLRPYPRAGNSTFTTFNWTLRRFSDLSFTASARVPARFPALW